MASVEGRIKKLEKKAVKVDAQLKKAKADLAALKAAGKQDSGQLKKRVAKLEKDVADIIDWIEAQVQWSVEVTTMLREIDWTALKAAFPGGGASNPPQTPPDWPMS